MKNAHTMEYQPTSLHQAAGGISQPGTGGSPFRCVRELGTPAAEIARYVGVNTSSVSRAIARMEEGDKS